MNPTDATQLIAHLLGVKLTADKQKDMESLMSLILAKHEPIKQSSVAEAPNDLPKEEKTINLADINHFEIPKEVNLQMEGEDTIRKIKIFPDGVSESSSEPVSK